MRTYILQKYSLATLLSAFYLLASGLSFAQSSNENYVQSKTCLNEDCSKKSETITYFDGLGRPKQIVSVKSTPTGKDLVTAVTYDGFGRPVKDILPVPAPTQNSSIHPGITDESAANSYYGVSNAYSEKQLENSPLDRLLQQAAPGEAWKMSSGKTQKFSYDANLGNEVKKFGTTTTASTVNNVSTAVSSLWVASANSGFYPASALYKNTVTDEDGNPVTEFKNGQGQTVLIRRNDGSQNVDTYYVYNEYNQLAFVLSPKAVKQIELNNNVITDEILNELCYQYKYDGRNREVEKKIPGKDWEFMVYDKQDRLVLSQDGKLRTSDNTFSGRGWLFTKYDELGRVAYTGFYPNTDSRTQVQGQLNTLTASSPNTETRITNPIVLSGTNLYYRNLAFPSSGITLLTVSYYDTYPSEAPAVPATVLGQPTMSQTLGGSDDASTKGMATASYVKNIEDNNWTKAYPYYDSTGRQIAVKTTNHLGGYTNTETELDFAGVTKLSKTYHKRLSADTEKVITETFAYDSQNRLLVHKHQVDNNPEEILAQNTYNDLSQLTNKKVGGTVASSPLQSIDYLYNIRGWMTKINDPSNLNGKLFGYEIKYNNPENAGAVPGRFNGNIAEIDWNNAEENLLKRYNYEYDPLNRLKNAFYKEPTTGVDTSFDEYLSYDVNGNIMNLKRYAPQVSSPTATKVDDLDYQYTGNRLTRIIENALNNTGYEGGNNLIDYDINGSMVNMKDKGIQWIGYNYLSLPDQFGITQKDPFGTDTNFNLSYLYRADGIKVRKTYSTGGGRGQATSYKHTDYLDGFQYSFSETVQPCLWCRTSVAYEEQAFREPVFPGTLNPAWILDFVNTSEGVYSFTENRYIYQYVDHLGNVRVNYAKDSQGNLELTNTNNYYAFGMNHIGGVKSMLGGYKNYKYNGKEIQESGMYDYGARFYMADVGRWGVVDPLAEIYRRWSPYNYAVNNPIRFIDPDGRGVTDVIITGDLKDKAFKQLQSKTTNLDLKIDKNGKVTGSVKEGATATKAEQKLLEATNDKSVIVNLEATSANQTADGNYIVSGAYGGNKVVEGENGETITEGYQILNPHQAEKVDKAEKSPQGSAALHEILESYISASETPGSSKENKQSYLNAHNKASALDPDRIRNGMPGRDIKKNRDGSITEKIYLDINGKKYHLYENKISK
ncbi:DUF6443 domain-containing protein [Chryseobacterium hagamense]|uniref:DUF6443 domain-containing protein n=1 Tax=Chryseobacterium hagamense TaxID=395935 RepID=A0A511YP34_9FLAO|nr:DUF6443 domain-containing protein [Chryseobacterium hagamense]GEN76926.1 hypothetical protein CHA01nite_26660 [Chryseobacterium hagamense]